MTIDPKNLNLNSNYYTFEMGEKGLRAEAHEDPEHDIVDNILVTINNLALYFPVENEGQLLEPDILRAQGNAYRQGISRDIGKAPAEDQGSLKNKINALRDKIFAQPESGR
jgi:hypothetical protein